MPLDQGFSKMTLISIMRPKHCLIPLPYLLSSLLALCVVATLNAQAPPTATAPASTVDLIAIRALIDKGHAAEALQQLDSLALQKPEASGVERLRGVALYAQNNFAEADRAFA